MTIERVNLIDRIGVSATRGRRFSDEIQLIGRHRFEHIRGGKIIAASDYYENLIMTEGKRYLLDAALDNSAFGFTEKTAWYIMLINNSPAPTVPDVGQTYANFHGSAVTEYTAYTGGARKTWNGVLDNTLAKITNAASKAVFTFSGSSGNVYGAALVSNSTQNHNTSGDYLLSYKGFTTGVQAVEIDDVINVEIELSFT